MIKISIKERVHNALIYLMNRKYDVGPPSKEYYRVIEKGYCDWDLDQDYLVKAAKHSIYKDSGNSYHSKKWNTNNLKLWN